MYTIIFKQNGNEIRTSANYGDNLLEVARNTGIDIDAPCSGNGQCGKCRVILVEGELQGGAARQLYDDDIRKGVRLACQSRISGDAIIEVPETAGSFRFGIVTADLSNEKEQRAFDDVTESLSSFGISRLDNGFMIINLTIDEPTLDDTISDVDRVKLAVMAETGCDNVQFSSVFVKKVARVIRDNNFSFCLPAEKRNNGSVFVYDILP